MTCIEQPSSPTLWELRRHLPACIAFHIVPLSFVLGWKYNADIVGAVTC